MFDEILMYDIQQLQMIHRFIVQHENNIKFIATGDSDQLIHFLNVG